MILDGKIVEFDRLTRYTSKNGNTTDAWHCAKARDFGGNIQALMRPDGPI